MKWIRFRVRTTVEAEDILVSAMQDIGLFGAQIENHVPLSALEKEQMFVDILPDAQEDDGSSNVSFYAEEIEPGLVRIESVDIDSGEKGFEDVPPEEVCMRIEKVIEDLRQYSDILGEGKVIVEETEDLDWINNWKQYFHQFRIDDILIIPSWEEPEKQGEEPRLTLHIDPGTAFGTGMHETTQLCIRAMREYITPETKMLDVGTGSGILGITALKLGAKEAVGTDLDPQSLPAVIDNLFQNGLLKERPAEEQIAKVLSELAETGKNIKEKDEEVLEFDFDRFRLFFGNLIDDEGLQIEIGEECYDIVAANILPDVLLPLTPAAERALKRGGVYITSGILAGKEESVADAMREAGLTILAVTAQGEWRCVIGKKER